MKKKLSNTTEDAFLREVNEEVKNDQMKALWKKYGIYIVILMVIVLTAAVSYESFKAYRIKNSEKWSDRYSAALSLQAQGKYDESIKAFEEIKNSGQDIYQDISQIQISNIYFEQGKTAEAIAILEELAASDKINKKLKDMSIIKLASYKLDTAPKDEIVSLLSPLANEESSWSNIAKEMLAMLYIREGDYPEARAMYESILSSPSIDEDLSLRVKDMLSTLSVIE